MDIKIAKHIQEVNAYKPGKTIRQLVKEYNLDEFAVLWNNENPHGVSPKAVKAMRKAALKINFYSDPIALRLRRKLAEKHQCNVENIALGNGGESLLMNFIRGFCSGEDELLTSEGSFVIIYLWSKINNVVCKQVPMTIDYRFDMQAILDGITPKTKIIYLANPNNPTGAMITKKELDVFLTKVPSHILVILDEAYFEYAEELSEEYPNGLGYNYENLVLLRTFSKAYGLAGIRIGYAIGNEQVIEVLNKIKLTFEPGNVAQAAALGALKDDDFLKKTAESNREAIEYFYQTFDALNIKYIPSFCNFVMIDLETQERATLYAEELMKRGVFVRHLKGGKLSHCLRISTGTDETNELFVEKLKEVAGLN